MQKKEIKRGDLFYYDFGEKKGSIQSGVRPVLVVQADCYNQNAPTVIVVCLSTAVKKRYLPSHIVIGEDFGLKKPSMILLEQIQTVSKEHLTDYIGNVDDERLWKRINITLKKDFRPVVLQEGRKRRYSLSVSKVPERISAQSELYSTAC